MATPEALVLVNPHAASGRAAGLVPGLSQALAGTRARLEVAVTVEQARSLLLAQPEGGRVVLAGGDGSLHQVLPALLERRLELALLPCGTGNDSARALGVHGMHWREALEHGLSAPASAVDTGEVITPQGRRPFFSSLAAGFDAAVGERALHAPALLRGTARYLWATLGELRALRSCAMRVVADGRPVHEGAALFASALNTRSYGSGMPAVPHARIDDGRLDLLVAGHFGRLATLAMMPRLLTGTHLTHPRVHAYAFTVAEVQADRPVPLAADGEPLAAATHFEMRVVPASLQVVRRDPARR